MALAFLVMVHRDAHQVGRLMRAIWTPGNSYVVHVDRKAPSDVHRGVQAELEDLPDVEMLDSRPVRWGGWSMVDAQLRAMRHLLQSPAPWSHFVNLSGQDFPLRPVQAMEAEAASHPHRNYVEFFRPEEVPWTWHNPAFPVGSEEHDRPASRVDRYYVEIPRRGVRPVPVVRRRFPVGLTWYGGSQWVVLSRDACRYLCDDPAARRQARFYRHTFIPDESYVQTALLSSPLEDTVVNDNRRVIEWQPELVTFTLAHRDLLLSSNAWFARKFDERKDPGILDLLETHIAKQR